MYKYFYSIALSSLILLLSSTVIEAAPLYIQDNTIMSPAGTRFIVKGANVEAYRDYEGGCHWVTDNLFPNSNGAAGLNPMITKMKSLGINAVRLNYSFNFISNNACYSNYGGNLSKYLDIAQAFANNGIYVMIADHSQTSTPQAYREYAYPMFKQILDGAKARDISDYVFVNPFNEPANYNNEWPEWLTASQDIVYYFRKTLGYTGIIMLDTPEWSSMNNLTNFQKMMQYDAWANGGKSNIGFENHWYPNHAWADITNSMTIAKNAPIVIGELGQENPGASPLTPQFPINVMDQVVNVGIPNGHNGIFAWIWNWCDVNKMTGEPWTNYDALTTYGQSYVPNYYSKALSSNISSTFSPPPSQATPTPRPTASPTPPPYNGLNITLKGSSSKANTSASSSLVINVPAGVATNDFLLAQIVVSGGKQTTITSPTGWTLLKRDNMIDSEDPADPVDTIAMATYYKFAGTNESSYTFTFSPAWLASGGIVAYQNVNQNTPIDTLSSYYNVETSQVLAPSVNTTNAKDMLVFLAGSTINTTIVNPCNSGMTQRWHVTNGTNTLGTTATMSDQLLNSAGATGNRDSYFTNKDIYYSTITQLIALKPAPSGGTTSPSVTLSPTPTNAKPGDTNNDGNVNGNDYAVWNTNYKPGITQSGGSSVADFNIDTSIDGVDYTIWLNNYGK